MEEKFMRYKNLEWSVPALTIRDKDGNYNIYVDPRQSYSTQKEACRHELNHIDKGHFDSNKPLSELEDEADR